MDEPLDEQYLKWLYSRVASVKLRNPARTYWSLFEILFNIEFDWTVPNDDNRVEDGRDLRKEFILDLNLRPNTEWMRIKCSMLEMLIALSRRLAYETETESREWFFTMLSNVELHVYTDAYFKQCDESIIKKTLQRIIRREYNPDGQGGLFPLKYPQEDQRDVELWYQSAAYLLELD